MKSIDTTLRILWLSDIHYKSEYQNKNTVLEQYIAGFQDLCLKIHSDNPIDYILLSGDIAQAGTAEDYDQFKADILKPLQDSLPGARLLLIPGNHDVYRGAGDFLEEFIKSLEKRNEFFARRYDDFEQVFKNYTEAFKTNAGIYGGCSADYKANLLQGYLVDNKKKTIFIMFNSAWYSFDRLFLERYLIQRGIIKNEEQKPEIRKIVSDLWTQIGRYLCYRVFAKRSDDESKRQDQAAKDKIKEEMIKDIQNIANEYGSQIIGLDKYKEFKELEEVLNYYSDYMVITTMHHPANWLSWDDRVNSVNNRFKSISGKTDIMLTGHEHVPKSHASEFLNERKLFHIQAGCFINAQDPTVFKVKDNWFSVLSINVNKRSIVNEKYFYSAGDNTWSADKDYLSARKLGRKDNKKLADARRSALKAQTDSLASEGKLLKKLFGVALEGTGDYSVNETSLYRLIGEKEELDLEMLKQALNKEDKIEFVYLVFVDLYHEEKKEYSSGRDRLLVLQDIKLKIDFQVNKFRHGFFSALSTEEAARFKNLKIISFIVPYWEYESMTD